MVFLANGQRQEDVNYNFRHTNTLPICSQSQCAYINCSLICILTCHQGRIWDLHNSTGLLELPLLLHLGQEGDISWALGFMSLFI